MIFFKIFLVFYSAFILTGILFWGSSFLSGIPLKVKDVLGASQFVLGCLMLPLTLLFEVYLGFFAVLILLRLTFIHFRDKDLPKKFSIPIQAFCLIVFILISIPVLSFFF